MISKLYLCLLDSFFFFIIIDPAKNVNHLPNLMLNELEDNLTKEEKFLPSFFVNENDLRAIFRLTWRKIDPLWL